MDDTEGTDQPEIWPGADVHIAYNLSILTRDTGKDYSNPRVTDFHTLNKPEEDMYDRTKVPRMPWYISLSYLALKIECALFRHDVGMQVVGQPARDLARHFVQRLVMG